MSTEPTSLTARPKPAKIAVAIPYRASFRTTRAASRRVPPARARRRGRRRQPGDGREADRRDRRRREYELRHDHRLSGEDELKRPERSLIRDREQDQEADDHAGKPHSRVDDGLHDPLARELGEPDYDGDGNAEQCAQRHGGDAHVQRDVDDAPDVAVPEREIEEGESSCATGSIGTLTRQTSRYSNLPERTAGSRDSPRSPRGRTAVRRSSGTRRSRLGCWGW